jgi:hypothetical protein
MEHRVDLAVLVGFAIVDVGIAEPGAVVGQILEPVRDVPTGSSILTLRMPLLRFLSGCASGSQSLKSPTTETLAVGGGEREGDLRRPSSWLRNP